MPASSKVHYVGQLQQASGRPENIELVVEERANITTEERAAGIKWVDSRYEPGFLLRYGTNTTPGTTDMTTALTNALAGNAGDIVSLPAEIILTGPQALDTLTGGIKIVGKGRGLTTLKLKETSGSPEIFGSTDNDLSDISIRDLTIDCNLAVHGSGGSAPNTNVTGIRLGDTTVSGDTSSNITVDNVEIIEPTQHGIVITRCINPKVSGCYINGFEGFGILYFRGCEDGVIAHNRVATKGVSASIGIQVDDRSTTSTTPEANKYITVIGNTIDGNSELSNGIKSVASLGVTISGNTVQLCGVGIYTGANESNSTTLRDGSECVISGNVIGDSYSTGNDSGGILIEGSHNTVVGNVVKDGAGNGIAFKVGHASLTMTGNVLKGNVLKDNNTTNGAEILVQLGQNVSIEGNAISAGGYGIRIASFDAAIKGCQVKGNTIKAGTEHAIEIRNDSGDVTEITLDGNEITNVASAKDGISINDVSANALNDIVISHNSIHDEAAASDGIAILDAGIADIRVEFNNIDCTTPFNDSTTNADIVFRYGNSFDRRVVYGTAAPTGGTWTAGDEVQRLTPVAGGKRGFLCTTGGTPGTWKEWGVIDA